jgi:hypothetical protein
MASGQPRVPFTPPGGFYTPRLPRTSFQTHLRPFATMSPTMAQQWRPPIPNEMRPVPRRPQPAPPPQVMTAVPSSAPNIKGSMFGRGLSPYAIMRSGLIPGITQNQRGIRSGITNAPMVIKQATPGPYTGANDPAGREPY